MYKVRLTIVIALLVAVFGASGQGPDPLVTEDSCALSFRERESNQLIADASPLFTGRQYLRNGARAKGTAFYVADSLFNGTVLFDGHYYENYPLQYDEVNDLLVGRNADRSGFIALTGEKVSWFVLNGTRFIRMVPDKKKSALPASGFYQLITGGKVQVLARREKRLILSSGTTEDASRYRESVDYYILRDGQSFPANDIKDALKAFSDKKEAIREYAKSNNLDFKRMPETALASIANYYSGLTQ